MDLLNFLQKEAKKILPAEAISALQERGEQLGSQHPRFSLAAHHQRPRFVRHSPIRIFSFLTCAAALGFAVPSQAGSTSSGGGNNASLSGTEGAAQREIIRRLGDANRATELLKEGDKLNATGDHATALSTYSTALDLVKAAPGTVDLRNSILERFTTASVKQAKTLASTGHYEEASRLLTSIVEDKEFRAYNTEATALLQRIKDPKRYNPALTPEHVGRIQQVQSLLLMANDLTELGSYDAANEAFKEILRLDGTNRAARRGMERVDNLKAAYAADARGHTRAKLLAEIDANWEESIPPAPENLASLFGAEGNSETPTSSRASLKNKLTDIILPNVVLEGATLSEVVEYLANQSRALDRSSLNQDERGISIVIRGGDDYRNKPVDLNVSNLPIGEVLRYAAEKAGMRVEVESYAVALMPLTDTSNTLISRTYRVPPGFIETQTMDASGGADADPFADEVIGDGASNLAHRRLTAREFLQQHGIVFPEGAAASYNPKTSMLLVRNTQENINFIESLIDQALSSTPRQVEIRITMLEVLQDNIAEVGYDWLIDEFNIGGERVFGTGGTEGNQRNSSLLPTEFGFSDPSYMGTPLGNNPITMGLRDASALQEAEAVDDLLRGRGFIRSRSGGQFSLAGAFTDPQFQMIMTKISQSKTIDIMAAPSLLTKSGQRAVVEIGRGLPYPIEFELPEIGDGTSGFDSVLVPTITGEPDPDVLGGSEVLFGSDFYPITPTTPTSFETRNVGFTLEAEPVIGSDNRTIDLNISVESVAFEGFVNYGSPFLDETGQELTSNEIIQPIFRTTRGSNSVTLYDGQTIALAGYVGDISKDIEDEVPLIGRLPGLGHFFQSSVTDVQRRHIIVMVTCNILDPAGRRINTVLE